jgi:alpha-galactosidase
MATPASSPVTTPADMALSRSLAASLLASPAQLPCSFLYGGKQISGLPEAWQPVTTTRTVDANLIETVHEGTDPETGLRVRVEVLRYRDFPVVEWVVWLTNTGSAPTPLLRDLRALDASFPGQAPVLHHCNGDFYSEEGYRPEETPLPEGAELTFAPNGGRPCDGAFPYFRLQFAGGGLTLAVGWPAQWSATFRGLADGVVVQAGQQLTNLRLRPGECIRTPRMTVMSWTGDTTRAVNLWRRWYLAHVLPRPDGQPLQPALALAATDTGEEFTAATEENQLQYMERFTRQGFDYDVWWIDAGWYPCRDEHGDRRWPRTGTWEPDPERFPDGFAPIAARAKEHGARLLVWFEPERVTKDSQLWREHPDWLLRSAPTAGGEDQNALLNLGNPECRQWLTDHVCALIQSSGLGVYRQDFNFPPLAYWRDNDAEDRQGMNENLHVQGYLRYWDDLLARNPGLWIDSCSSGGRRNDLETMRRAVPLHYTDYGYGLHPVKLSFHHTLFQWIPYFKEATLSWDQNPPDYDGRFDRVIDSFSFHCGLAAMLFATIDIRRDDYDFALGREMIALWRRAAPLLLHGDYYPLTPFSRSGEQWVAWQFDRPESGEGFLQGIRLAACTEEVFTAHPKGLNPEAEYLLENPETGERRRLSGAALLGEGLPLSLSARSGAIWFYKRV